MSSAARGVPIVGLAGYEPPHMAADDGSGGSMKLLEGIRARIGAGDRDGAAALFMQGVGTRPRSSP